MSNLVLPIVKSYQRLDAFPLDSKSVFSTYADLTAYAATYPTAHAGQICSVSGVDTAYIIRADKGVIPLNTNALSGRWESVYTSVANTSANWDSVYSNVLTNSAKYNTQIQGTSNEIVVTNPSDGQWTISLPTELEVPGNLSVNGNLFVSGSSTFINTTDLIVKDPIIYLAEGNESDIVESGFTIAYNYNFEPHRHAGFIRDSITKKWTLFSNLSSEVLSAVNIDLNDQSLVIDTLRANIEGTLTGNVSGTAAIANKLTTGRTISASGDISYVSGSFDGTANVTGTATIQPNVVTFSKIQQIPTDTLLGRATAGNGNVETITCTAQARSFLDDATAAAQATTIGLGTGNSVTFQDVTVNNGSKSANTDIYNASVSNNNTLTVNTFAKASFNTSRFVVQIKKTTTGNRAACEIIATNNNGTWEGSVYGIIDPAIIFSNVEVSTTGTTVDLVFTLNGNSDYSITVLSNHIND
jgi:hypothetical protein